jgi:hypothetical protein
MDQKVKKPAKERKNPGSRKVFPFLLGTCANFISQKAEGWQPKKNIDMTEKPLPNNYIVIILYIEVAGVVRLPLCPS